jgi:hypothetical protein
VIVAIASGTLLSSVVSKRTLITIAAIAIIADTVTVVAASGNVAISNTIFIIITKEDL